MDVPLALVWVVWIDRNRKSFEGVEYDFVNIRDDFFMFRFLLVQP